MNGTASLLLLAVLAAGCSGEIQPEDDSDPAIKARIQLSLQGRKDVDARFVTIDVTNALVTISGIVPSSDQIQIIDRIAKRTPGVDSVMDNLVIQE